METALRVRIIEKIKGKPTFPLLPAYNSDGDLSWADFMQYINILSADSANVFMTTAGTTQFNLLSNDEILTLNHLTTDRINHDQFVILGLPPIARIIPHIDHYSSRYKHYENVAIMVLYPDRFYTSQEVIDYFTWVNENSKVPFFIHCKPFIDGITGQLKDWTPELIIQIAEKCNKFVGIKEECMSFSEARKFCYAIPKELLLTVIVAGKSMARYHHINRKIYKKAHSFLAGLGSLYPSVETIFMSKYHNSYEQSEAIRIINEIEASFFKDFMACGWHRSLRYAINSKIVSLGWRRPMQPPNNLICNKLDQALIELNEKITNQILKRIDE